MSFFLLLLTALSFPLHATALKISPINLSSQALPSPEITDPARLQKRAESIPFCPEGVTTNFPVIGIDKVLSEPGSGHYIPECNSVGSCQYIGYAVPSSPFTGSTSYEMISATGEVSLPFHLYHRRFIETRGEACHLERDHAVSRYKRSYLYSSG